MTTGTQSTHYSRLDLESADAKQPMSTGKDLLEWLTKAVGALALCLYLTGAVITNVFLVSYGITELAAVDLAYFPAGFTFWLIILSPGYVLLVATSARIFSMRRRAGWSYECRSIWSSVTGHALGAHAGIPVQAQDDKKFGIQADARRREQWQ